MKTDFRQFAAEQGIAEVGAPKKGMGQKTREFAELLAEIYSNV